MVQYIGYYYDNTREQAPGFDSNELIVNGKFSCMITSCRTSHDLSELMPREETEELIMIVPTSKCPIDVINYNPCPEFI